MATPADPAPRQEPELRAGQRAFNLLYATRPDVAEQIRGTEHDPFYDDTRLVGFNRRVDELLTADQPAPMTGPDRPTPSET